MFVGLGVEANPLCSDVRGIDLPGPLLLQIPVVVSVVVVVVVIVVVVFAIFVVPVAVVDYETVAFGVVAFGVVVVGAIVVVVVVVVFVVVAFTVGALTVGAESTFVVTIARGFPFAVSVTSVDVSRDEAYLVAVAMRFCAFVAILSGGFLGRGVFE